MVPDLRSVHTGEEVAVVASAVVDEVAVGQETHTSFIVRFIVERQRDVSEAALQSSDPAARAVVDLCRVAALQVAHCRPEAVLVGGAVQQLRLQLQSAERALGVQSLFQKARGHAHLRDGVPGPQIHNFRSPGKRIRGMGGGVIG